MAVGDNRATDPWMEWLFARTFFYPYPPAGIQDLMISNSDRDGRSPIGSRSYTLGDFSAAGSRPCSTRTWPPGQSEIRPPRPAPLSKAAASTSFWLQQWTAGLYFLRIGNVTGPDKPTRMVSASCLTCARMAVDQRPAIRLCAQAFRPARGLQFGAMAGDREGGRRDQASAVALTSQPRPARLGGVLESGRQHDDRGSAARWWCAWARAAAILTRMASTCNFTPMACP